MARALLGKKHSKRIRRKPVLVMLAIAACFLVAVGVTLNWKNKSKSDLDSRASVTIATSTPGKVTGDEPALKKAQVILLVAERIRGEQQVATYHIQPDSPVRLQIVLISATAHAAYAAKITSIDRLHVIWEEKGLKAAEENGQLLIEATLPARSLPPATYDMVVTGPGGELHSRFAVRP